MLPLRKIMTNLAALFFSRSSYTFGHLGSIALFFAFFSSVIGVQKGTCWSSMTAEYKCRNLLVDYKTTKEQCCILGGFYSSMDFLPSHGLIFIFFYRNQLFDCDSSCQDCSNINCREDQQCIMSADSQPTCQCNVQCSEDHQSSGQICGQDDRTYNSTCQLMQENCLSDRATEIHYHGQCRASTCQGVICYNERHRCAVNQYNQPMCVPVPPCPTMNATVCGTDNTTYISICHLTRENILSGSTVRLQYHGACTETKSCATDIRCQHCLYNNQTGSYHCLISPCAAACPQIDDSVCGTDGQTYLNKCVLRQQSCLLSIYVTVQHRGSCEEYARNNNTVRGESSAGLGDTVEFMQTINSMNAAT